MGDIMKNKKILSIVLLCILLFSVGSIGANAKTTGHFEIPGEYTLSTSIPSGITTDFDPLCDVQVTFELQKIRSLERTLPQLLVEKKNRYTKQS